MKSKPKRETGIVGDIVHALRARGAKVIKTHGDPFMPAGTPDLLGCAEGQAFGVEVKRPGEEPTPIQQRELRSWGRAGARVGRATSVEEALAVVFGKEQSTTQDPDRPGDTGGTGT